MNRSILVKYTKNISAYFSASLIPMALSLVTNPFVAMNMSPEDYAIVGYYGSFTSLLTPIVSFYFIHFYIKRYFESNEEERLKLKAAVFKLLVVYSFVSTLVCILGVFGYIKLFNSEIQFSIFPYLPLAILPIPLSGIYNLELADYKMQKNSKSYFRLSVIVGVINVISVLLFVVVIKMGAFGKLFAPFLINLLFFLYLFFKHKHLWNVHVEKPYFIEMFKFCWPLAAAAMMGYFTNGFDKTYLEKIGNLTEFGYYCVGASIAYYLHVFSTAISNTFQPDIYEAIANKNNSKLLKTYLVVTGMVTVIVVLFIILCPYLIYLLTAGRYMASTIYTRIISIATITQIIYNFTTNFTIGKGYPKISLWTSIIGSILVVVLMPIAVRNWTFVGGAWMAVFSYIIFFMVNVLFLVAKVGRIRTIGFIKSLLHK